MRPGNVFQEKENARYRNGQSWRAGRDGPGGRGTPGGGKKKVLAGNSETLRLPGVNRPSASAFYIGERPEYVQAGEKGVRKKISGHASLLRKTKIPLWERAPSSHSASGTPDAISGQSGKLRQDAATVMKYSCLPTGNLECLSARRRCREGSKT